MTTHSLSLSVRAETIPSAGKRFRIEASEAERHALAEELGIPEVQELTADVHVRRLPGEAIAVEGSLAAVVVQADVVTLEPVRQSLDETLELTLVPAETAAEEQPEAGEGDADAPDLYHNGRIDLGALTAEHLALALDPYPRAPGVEFAAHIEDDSAASPFAALANLKKDKE